MSDNYVRRGSRDLNTAAMVAAPGLQAPTGEARIVVVMIALRASAAASKIAVVA